MPWLEAPKPKKNANFCRVPQFGQRRNSKLINLSKCTKVQSKVLLTLGFNSFAYVDLLPLGFYPQVGYRLFFLGQLPCFSLVKPAFPPWKISILPGKTSISAMQTSISPGETPRSTASAIFRHRDGAVLDVLRCEGRCLLTASADGTVRLWDAETGIIVGSWQGSTGINRDKPR